MKYKNYYKILELKSDKVTTEEIKTAYRRLAKQYHPDINPNNNIAAEKFKDVNEAYQILGNEESKKKYDRLHFAYKIKENFNISQIKSKVNSEGLNDFLNMFIGKEEKNKETQNLKRKGEDIETQIDITLEEAFEGKEKKIVLKTTTEKTKTISVKIPNGIKQGEKIKIANYGKPGQNGGEKGNLYIKVNFLENEKFKLDGSNLITNLYLTPWEAALGCKTEIEGIDSKIQVTVPAGIQTGEKLRIAGNGYYTKTGSRGDLLANVKIMVPKELTESEKQLFTELSKKSSFLPRKH